MEQKSWIAVGVLGALVIIVAVLVSGGSDDPVVVQQPDKSDLLIEETQLPVEQPVATTTPEQPVVTATTTAPSVATSSPVVTAPEKPVTPTVATYTLAQVSAHATANDCWTTMNGVVYNVTPFVSKHPGGVEAISQVCGRDGTAFFQAQHGGDKGPEGRLASLKIGVLGIGR